MANLGVEKFLHLAPDLGRRLLGPLFPGWPVMVLNPFGLEVPPFPSPSYKGSKYSYNSQVGSGAVWVISQAEEPVDLCWGSWVLQVGVRSHLLKGNP